jgi:hypothetical protein
MEREKPSFDSVLIGRLIDDRPHLQQVGAIGDTPPRHTHRRFHVADSIDPRFLQGLHPRVKTSHLAERRTWKWAAKILSLDPNRHPIDLVFFDWGVDDQRTNRFHFILAVSIRPFIK